MAGVAGKGRSGGRDPEPVAASYRPVWAIGLLLILEVVVIVALGTLAARRLLGIDWREVATRGPSPEVTEALTYGLFAPPAVLTLLAALGFLLLRRRGWLVAAISQGLTLAVCLWIYVAYEPLYVYPIMAYAVLMILYLNVHDVRAVFYPRSPENDLQTPRRPR